MFELQFNKKIRYGHSINCFAHRLLLMLPILLSMLARRHYQQQQVESCKD
jgi:hypothetical protein